MTSYEWLFRPDGRVFNNLTIADTAQGRRELEQITGESLMAAAESAGGKVAVFDSKAQFYAFHETSVSEKHPGLGGRDLVAEIIEAGKKRDIIYVPYIPIDCDERAFREHPEWRPCQADGTPMEDPQGWPRLCGNSPFGEFMADYVRELVSNYDVRGLWFDGVALYTTPTYCYCESCRNGFREQTGLEAPVDPAKDFPIWSEWKKYRHEAVRRMMARIREVAHEIKPGLPILAGYGWHNWHYNTDSYFSECDMIWHEASWFWPTSSIQYLRALSGRPPEYYIPSSVHAPSYPLSLPEQELRAKAMENLANGGLPIFTLDGSAERLRPINDELAARAEWVMDTENIPYCGVVFSARSMHSTDPSPYSESSHFASYGILHALLEEKIPEHYLADRHLDGGDLGDFAALVLPDIGYLPERAADNLRRYVENGGGLVAFAGTSLHGEDGALRDDFSLADLFGVHYRGEMAEITELPSWWGDLRRGGTYPNQARMKFLALGDHPIVQDELIRQSAAVEAVAPFLRGKPSDYPLAYFGQMLKVEPEPGVESVLWEGLQEPGTHRPLITTRNFGKGRVVYVAGDFAPLQLGRVTHSYIRRLIGNAVRFAAGNRPAPFGVKAPLHVQATIFRQTQKSRVILHLLNAPTPAGLPPFTREEWKGRFPSTVRAQEEIVPVHDIEVRLLGEFKRVYTAPDRHALAMRFEDGYAHVRVPKLETHLMIVGEK
jgi:hypothetical protein